MTDETPYISRRERRQAAERALAQASVPPLRTSPGPATSLMEPEVTPSAPSVAPFAPPAAPVVSAAAPVAEPLVAGLASVETAEPEPLAALAPWGEEPVAPVADIPAENGWVPASNEVEEATAAPPIKLGWETDDTETESLDEDEDSGDEEQEAKPKLTRQQRKAERRANRSWWRPIVDFVAIVIAAALLAALLKAVAFRTFEVPSSSMDPTLQIGDRIVVELISRHFEPYKRGDVVVFKDPADWIGDGADPDEDPNILQLLGVVPEQSGYIVKRILAVPGETVEGLADGTILIDGAPVNDPYAPLSAQEPFTWVLSKGDYWMMGDNRPGSADSRVHGPVSEDEFIGRVAFKFFPFDRMGGLD